MIPPPMTSIPPPGMPPQMIPRFPPMMMPGMPPPMRMPPRMPTLFNLPPPPTLNQLQMNTGLPMRPPQPQLTPFMQNILQRPTSAQNIIQQPSKAKVSQPPPPPGTVPLSVPLPTVTVLPSSPGPETKTSSTALAVPQGVKRPLPSTGAAQPPAKKPTTDVRYRSVVFGSHLAEEALQIQQEALKTNNIKEITRTSYKVNTDMSKLYDPFVLFAVYTSYDLGAAKYDDCRIALFWPNLRFQINLNSLCMDVKTQSS